MNERERFEAWICSLMSEHVAAYMLKKHDSAYTNWLTQRDWETWQAAIIFKVENA
jgi:hypothetical protein